MAVINDVDWWSKEDQIRYYHYKLAGDYHHMLHETELLKNTAFFSECPELKEAMSRMQSSLLRQRDEVSDVFNMVLIRIKSLQEMATPGVPPQWCDKTWKESDE